MTIRMSEGRNSFTTILKNRMSQIFWIFFANAHKWKPHPWKLQEPRTRYHTSSNSVSLEFFPPMNCFLGRKSKPVLPSIKGLLVLDLSNAYLPFFKKKKKEKIPCTLFFYPARLVFFLRNNPAFSHEYIFFLLLPSVWIMFEQSKLTT